MIDNNNSELEKLFQNLDIIGFSPVEENFLTGSNFPANLSLTFKNDTAIEAIEFYYLFRKEAENFSIKAVLSPTTDELMDFTLIIVKELPVIITAKNVKYRKDKLELFVKKQPIDQPIFLFITENWAPNTIKKMAEIAERATDTNFSQSILINAWKCVPFDISQMI
ncbi:MAG: hypothetical protein IPJ81_09000 [Chitinophagaceae bacterium]|nr:hypothetical protein [Chitinophagaceae bacterium]